MEKITKDIIHRFISKNKIELFSTHTKLCVPIINRIFLKMLVGINFSGIKVENNLICDGHHRYLASLLANISIERIPTMITSATTAINWDLVIFEDADWDTQAKIDMLNDEDAKYNNISLAKIIHLLK